jgi:hypothetical protein
MNLSDHSGSEDRDTQGIRTDVFFKDVNHNDSAFGAGFDCSLLEAKRT